jgi:hypothetical protein
MLNSFWRKVSRDLYAAGTLYYFNTEKKEGATVWKFRSETSFLKIQFML